jgi:hypothetical protein
MLYPSSTYFTALTSQASQRWLNAAFRLEKYGKITLLIFNLTCGK